MLDASILAIAEALGETEARAIAEIGDVLTVRGTNAAAEWLYRVERMLLECDAGVEYVGIMVGVLYRMDGTRRTKAGAWFALVRSELASDERAWMQRLKAERVAASLPVAPPPPVPPVATQGPTHTARPVKAPPKRTAAERPIPRLAKPKNGPMPVVEYRRSRSS